MAISSQGIGSGLDVNSIVTQLVAIEKQPLKTLQTAASKLQSQVSVYGTIKSQIATLQDAATKLARDSSWAVQTATSSNTAAATVSVDSTASSADFSLEITSLAKAQTGFTQDIASKTAIGSDGETGNLLIQLGSWGVGGAGPFVDTNTAVEIPVKGTDTYATIAAAINAKNAGVRATVLTSGGKDRLLLQSSNTGIDAGFEVKSDNGFTALDALAGSTSYNEYGADAAVKVNGVSVTSSSNTMTKEIPGVTINLLKEISTTQISVVQDKAGIQANVQAFADAYTALNKTLSDATKYVPGGQSGVLQGDTTTVGLQRLMRQMFGLTTSGSGSVVQTDLKYMSNIGLETQADGSLKVNATSLTSAMANMTSLQSLFTYGTKGTFNVTTGKTEYDKTKDGFGVKFRELTKGLLNVGGGSSSVSADNGFVTNKAAALQASISRNSDAQDKVTERAAAVEKRLRVQYSALDAKMASMSSLSSYVTAQLAQWNKSSS